MSKLFVLLLLSSPCWAQEPLIRVIQEPEGAVHSGQSIVLRVQVLVPNYFLGAPDFPRIEWVGGPAGELQDSGGNVFQRIDEQDYAGIERTYRFPPLAAGEHSLAPAEVRLRYADEHHRALDARLSLPNMRIQVNSMAPEYSAQSHTRAQLSVSETYQPDTTPLQSGDLLTRRLQIELREPGHLLPPTPTLNTPTGVRVYRRATQLEKTDGRSGQTIRRIDEVHYLFERAGPIVLPAIQLHWRNTLTGQLEMAELPARHLSIAEHDEPLAAPVQRYAVHLSLFGLLIALLGGTLYRWQGWRQRCAAWQKERKHWRAFRQACASGHLDAVETSLEHWLQLNPAPEPLRRVRDTNMPEAIQALLRARYAANASYFDVQELYRAAAQVRQQRKTRPKPTAHPQQLNPDSD